MGDGVQLVANVFRPSVRAPVLLSATPYRKDALPDRLSTLLMRLSGVPTGGWMPASMVERYRTFAAPLPHRA